METFLIRALQLILSLSILVIVHEGGHFFFARLFKIRVEKFYIFFDRSFIFSSTLGSLCSSISRSIAIRSME